MFNRSVLMVLTCTFLEISLVEVAVADWWKPSPPTSWQVQYTGRLDTSVDVMAYNIDLFDTQDSKIELLHSQGKKVICYFSAGSYEDWRPDAKRFPSSVKGRNNGWPGEKWLDIRRLDVLLPIMADRMALAAQKGCDAVDPDNVDGYTNNTGFRLSYQDQLSYNIALAETAHSLDLAVSLKNDVEQVKDLVDYFDFAVNEECFSWDECATLLPFIHAGKPVLGIEYSLGTSRFCASSQCDEFRFSEKKNKLGRLAACLPLVRSSTVPRARAVEADTGHGLTVIPLLR